MKKVLFVINSLTIGGSEKSLVSLLNLLNYSKYEVDLLMIRKGGEFEKYIPCQVNILKELNYYRYLVNHKESEGFIKKSRFEFFRIKTSINLRKNIRQAKPLHTEQILYKSHSSLLENMSKEYDIAIAYSQGLPTYFVADKVKAKKKYAWINCDYETTMYDKQYDEQYYAKYDKVVVVSNSIKESIIRIKPNYESKLEVILDVVDSKLIQTMAEEKKPFEDKTSINILTVARLVIVHKGYDTAIKAAKLLKDNECNFKWFVIGDGPDKEKMNKIILENGLENHFILLGEKANPYPYMKNCDIYVQPSKKEGFGLTVVEAKILKRPIVCTNFNTAKEIIKNEVDGLVVDQTPKALFTGIQRYLKDKTCINLILTNLNLIGTYNSISEIEKINILLKQ
ncbi:MAG: glycosyltransferase [Clostridium sp.]|uniref:glycosyltransferase n=1 Tax=Clostridium sp. TaxID=1506 RepID=UPI0030351936